MPDLLVTYYPHREQSVSANKLELTAHRLHQHGMNQLIRSHTLATVIFHLSL